MKKNNISNGELPKQSMSLTSVFIFLGIIFSLLLIIVFYLRFSSWSPFYDLYKKTPKLENLSLLDRFNKEKDVSALTTIDLKITELELAKSIGVDNDSFVLKKASLKIKPEGIIINGRTSNVVWGVPVEIMLNTRIINQKLFIEVSEIKAAGVVAPPKIANNLMPKINSAVSNAIIGSTLR